MRKRFTIFILILNIVLLLTGCNSNGYNIPSKMNIYGNVRDNEFGCNLEGALVQIEENNGLFINSEETDKNGTFNLGKISTGKKYRIQVCDTKFIPYGSFAEGNVETIGLNYDLERELSVPELAGSDSYYLPDLPVTPNLILQNITYDTFFNEIRGLISNNAKHIYNEVHLQFEVQNQIFNTNIGTIKAEEKNKSWTINIGLASWNKYNVSNILFFSDEFVAAE